MKNIIFVSDLHVRSDIPVCRTDDFLLVQENTLNLIAQTALEHKAIVMIAGDIFHRPKPLNPQYLENILFDTFRGVHKIYFVMGNPNHDLKGSNIDNINDCSIGVIKRFPNWLYIENETIHQSISPWSQKGVRSKYNSYIINGFDFGQEIKNTSDEETLNVAVIHKFVSDTPLPPWLQDRGIIAKDLCEKYPNYNIFVTGDNHKCFTYTHPKTGQIVVNPGCITRQKLSEKDYLPRFFMYNIETKNLAPFVLPDNSPNVIRKSDKSKLQEERESRIDSFLQLAGNKKEITWDYPANLRLHCKKNKVEKEVEEEINNILEEVNA